MYSLNVPVPGEVERLAEELRTRLLEFDSIRDSHTLLCKRLGELPEGGAPRLREQVRTALVGAPTFEVRVTGIDCFERPPIGEGPVLYFAIESPGIHCVHNRLLPQFSTVEEFQGEDYTPHITLARGGDVETARRLCEREIEPITWTAKQLVLWDARYREELATFSLPA